MATKLVFNPLHGTFDLVQDVSGFLPLAGGTMTGDITLANTVGSLKTGNYPMQFKSFKTNEVNAVAYLFDTSVAISLSGAKPYTFKIGGNEAMWVGANAGAWGGTTNNSTGGYAFGQANTAGASYTTCFGYGNTASGNGVIAAGLSNNNAALYGVSLGFSNTVGGMAFFGGAVGSFNNVTGSGAYAVGGSNTIPGSGSFALGSTNVMDAAGSDSTAVGNNNTINASKSVVVGANCIAQSTAAAPTIVGNNSVAESIFPVIVGNYVTCGGNNATIIGNAPATGGRMTRANSFAIFSNHVLPAVMNERLKYAAWEQKRLGLFELDSLDTEVLTNGTFTGSATGWTLGTGWAYGTNNVTKNAAGTGTLTQALTGLEIGAVYVLSFVVSSWTAGSFTPSMPTGTYTYNSRKTNGTFYETFIATSATDTLTFTPTDDARFVIDTISLKKSTGGNLSVMGTSYLRSVVMTDAKNVTVGTTTGTKIGTATTEKLGFWNATPIVQPSAFTQTYSTATKTHAALTSATLTDSTGGTADTTVAAITAVGGAGATTQQETDINNNFADVIAQINALRTDLENAKQVINAVIDDGQAEGLLA